MTKFVSLLGRKPEPGAEKPSVGLPPAPTLTPVSSASNEPGGDLDDELFFPLAAQLGEENEAVRGLLLDAERKIGELETIKLSIAKLVDPVCNTLRGYEETKNEKLVLQRTLKNSRDAYNKVRDDLLAAEKKTATFKAECSRLQEIATTAKQNVAALERCKAEHLAEIGAQRAHVAELQRLAQQQSSDLRLAREENRRLGERIAAADQRTVQLEGQVQSAQQQARQANQERAATQASLEKALGELAQTARRVSEAEKAFDAAQARLKATEVNLAEVQAERTRLGAALDEAVHRHREEANLVNSRFESTQARLRLTEGLLEDARQALMARADEIRAFERRSAEAAAANDALAEKLSTVEASLAERELQVSDLEQARATLTEQAQKLLQVATSRQGHYERAQQKIGEQDDLVVALQQQLAATQAAGEMQVETFNAQMQRERLERSMAEGALEAARKDILRLQQEMAILRGHSASATAEAGTPSAMKRAA
jgi:crescentin